MSGVLATGEIWLKVPESIRIRWDGTLRDGVMAKDISLKTIQKTGHSGATYNTMEYCGEAIHSLNMDERMCLTNMAVETGAKAGLVGCDEVTAAYLKENFGITGDFSRFNPDRDAAYCESLVFDASELVPQVACPHEVDNVFDIDALDRIRVDQVYLGRPWRDYGYTLFMNCEMGRHIRPEGWHHWEKQREQTARYLEYNNHGEGAKTQERVVWSRQLTKKEADLITPASVFSLHSEWKDYCK